LSNLVVFGFHVAFVVLAVFSFTISAVLSIPLAVAYLLPEFFKFVLFNIAELVIRTLWLPP
jgi:hypothetical protein